MYATALDERARTIRATTIQMAHDGREGHLNGALSCVELLLCLFDGWLRIPREQEKAPERDRFIFSKGHACASLYAVLAERGYFPVSWLDRYATDDSPLPSHPCIHALPLLDCSAGSLGHGLGMATGKAYGLRLDGNSSRTVALISDGECNEGSTWESATFAASHKLDNLLLIVDNNGVQSVGRSDDLMGGTSLEEKFTSFGWAARTVEGNTTAAVKMALSEVPFVKGKPSVIVAKTTAGAGVSFMQDQVLWHYRVPSDDDLQRALQELGATPLHKRSNP
ncbi:transketolase [Geomonas edaphica]|uniref:transketolase n=1 Tax=Geomonas edaphica TaxID=2570226 RepID=UPI0010A90AB3|nr:transketolase [Geomonas edaphica]